MFTTRQIVRVLRDAETSFYVGSTFNAGDSRCYVRVQWIQRHGLRYAILAVDSDMQSGYLASYCPETGESWIRPEDRMPAGSYDSFDRPYDKAHARTVGYLRAFELMVA